MTISLSEQIAVESLGLDHFVSKALPDRAGNSLPIAYGGCTIAVGVHSACKTVPPGLKVYSVLGTFLGPSSLDRVLHCRVNRLRDTRSFATRHVLVLQVQDNGSERICAQLSVDFELPGPALLEYQTPPKKVYGQDPYDQNSFLSTTQLLQNSIDRGILNFTSADLYWKMYRLMDTHFEIRHSVDSVSTQNAYGLAKSARTTQDGLPMHEKTCAEWVRARHELSSYEENIAGLGFLLDGGLSFLPLHLNHMNFDDSSACSTLDFAIRLFVPGIELNDWHLKERRTVAASAGRTYSEQTLWTQGGHTAAVMSQMSILRPQGLTSTAKHAKI